MGDDDNSKESGDNKEVFYVSSENFLSACDCHPKVRSRATLVDSLLTAYGLKNEMRIVAPKLASNEDLLSFHTEEFVQCLNEIEKYFEENPVVETATGGNNLDYSAITEEIESDILSHGFGYDCEIFPEMLKYVKYVTGATLTAAEVLMRGETNIAVNLNGGWHHAHIDEVAGFCYANDIVIGILQLMKKFKRVLYIDLDVHHGDGVEEAFRYSKKVVTLSIHKFAEGFFPGTGNTDETGSGNAKYHTVNVPLKTGIRDEKYHKVFKTVFEKIIFAFIPQVIVCQCGADMLSGDPLGGFNLTSKGLVSCIKDIFQTNIPVLFLGGGGYQLPNTARCWTEMMAALVNKSLDENIPEHENLEKYGPDFSLHISKSNRKDENTDDYISSILEEVLENIKNIQDISENIESIITPQSVNKNNKPETLNLINGCTDDINVLKDVIENSQGKIESHMKRKLSDDSDESQPKKKEL